MKDPAASSFFIALIMSFAFFEDSLLVEVLPLRSGLDKLDKSFKGRIKSTHLWAMNDEICFLPLSSLVCSVKVGFRTSESSENKSQDEEPTFICWRAKFPCTRDAFADFIPPTIRKPVQQNENKKGLPTLTVPLNKYADAFGCLQRYTFL
jgi:hypothetical protein